MSFKRFAGVPGSVAYARAWTKTQLLGLMLDEEIIDKAVQIVDEFACNAIDHSRSGQLGGSYALDLDVDATHVRICVIDQGTNYTRLPAWGIMADPLAERGRGLAIVAALASQHFTVADEDRCMVRADIPLRVREGALS